jgi:hypothetical protein
MSPMAEAERHAEIAKACQAYRDQMAAAQHVAVFDTRQVSL